MRLSDRLRESFVAGLILVAPLLVTLYVVRILVNWTFGIVNPIVVETRLAQYTANVELVAQVLAVALPCSSWPSWGISPDGPSPTARSETWVGRSTSCRS